MGSNSGIAGLWGGSFWGWRGTGESCFFSPGIGDMDPLGQSLEASGQNNDFKCIKYIALQKNSYNEK